MRSSATKVRVSVELVDTASRASVFAQRFDRPLDDLFDVQDEITVAIYCPLEPRVRAVDMAYGARSGTVTAWRHHNPERLALDLRRCAAADAQACP